ncbi:MAG: AMP-binding protein [Campylobacterota bacterium]|nr:AMP-binding protein [Campylobacterota bacterium]
MILEVLNDDGTINYHDSQSIPLDPHNKKLTYIGSTSKEKNALDILKAYRNDSKIVLYDQSNEMIQKKINALDEREFLGQDFSMMFFTSGSMGHPVGALKTKQNLESEIKVFSKLIESYTIKKVIVTVPFVHIYGTLMGLLYPLFNDIDIVLKEHFLPHNLLELIDENCLVVTTPLYIKALNSLSENKDLSRCLFVSSTAPLDKNIANEFTHKYNTNTMQLFGSTETGGIAYKFNDEELWSPFQKVELSVNNEQELKVQSPFVSTLLYENGFIDIAGVMQTFDYVEFEQEQFKLIGRSSKIFKIAGKRYSTVQIEQILEEVEEISKALVFVKNNTNSLKGETLDISLETQKDFTSKEIIYILKQQLSNLKFVIDLHLLEHIPTNQIGKKLLLS